MIRRLSECNADSAVAILHLNSTHPMIMKHRAALLSLLLLSGCGAHPDREAVSQLMEDLRPHEEVDYVKLAENSGDEESVRAFGTLFVQQHQVLEDFLVEHPGITPSTRELVESARDAVQERAAMRNRMIEENEFEWTAEGFERDRELARQHLAGMFELMKIVDEE